MQVDDKRTKRSVQAKKITMQSIAITACVALLPLPTVSTLGVILSIFVMLKRLARLYQVEFNHIAVPSFLAAAAAGVFSLLAHGLCTAILKHVPAFGTLLSLISLPIICAGITFLLALRYIAYLEHAK